MYSLDSIEKKQNIKLPEEYKQLYNSDFNGISGNLEIYVNKEYIKICQFLRVDEIYEILEEDFDFFGYDIVPIAKTDYNDYICLYYAENVETPVIIYWDYELSTIHPKEGIFYLYNNISKFIDEINNNFSGLQSSNMDVY